MKVSLPIALFKILESHGIEHVVTVPGSQTVPLLDAARLQDKVELVIATNELSGAFIACGIACATRKAGVILSIPGPGFLFSLPGIAEAHSDSIPLLIILVRPRNTDKQFTLHNLDHQSIAATLIRRHFVIEQSGALEQQLELALRTTSEGEPGPVVVEIAQELLHEAVQLSFSAPPLVADLPTSSVTEFASLISDSSRPLFFLGKGASSVYVQLRQLVEDTNIPVISTASGRGIIADKDPLCFTTDFSTGLGLTIPELLAQADRIFVIGAKLTHNGTAGFTLKLPREKLVRVDQSVEVIEANYPAEKRVLVASEHQLLQLLSGVQEQLGKANYRSRWSSSELQKFRHSREKQLAQRLDLEPLIDGDERKALADFFRELQTLLPNESVYVCDSGFHQALARHYLKISQPQALIFPADLQTMGFGLSAAIGYALAKPDSEVVAILGDGGFCSTGLELLSALNRKLSLLVVLLDDRAYGLIRRQLLKESGNASFAARLNPDWNQFCAALGIKYFELQTDNESEALASAVHQPGIRLLRVPLTDSLRTTLSAAGAELKDKLRNLTKR